MVVPTKPFTLVSDARVDPDSPLDFTLFEDFRDNFVHLQEVLYGSFTAEIEHDHDGINSKAVDLTGSLSESEATLAGSTTAGGTTNLVLTHNFTSTGARWAMWHGAFEQIGAGTTADEFALFVGFSNGSVGKATGWRHDTVAGNQDLFTATENGAAGGLPGTVTRLATTFPTFGRATVTSFGNLSIVYTFVDNSAILGFNVRMHSFVSHFI